MKIAIIVLILAALTIVFAFVWRLTRRPPLDVVFKVRDDDPEMVAAIKQAQDTLADFIAAMQTPSKGQRYCLVKARIVEGTVSEHMWIADVIVEGDSFRGVLASQPESIRNLRFRQPVTVTRSQVSDWMIVQDGKAKGCFTMRVLDKRANADQRKARKQRFPFTFE